MYEAIVGVLAVVLSLVWLTVEIRCGTRMRIAVGLACVSLLAGGWLVAQWRMVQREAAQQARNEERLGWIKYCAEIGDMQKVQRLASPSNDSLSEGRGVRIWEEEDEIAGQIRELGGWATPCDRLNPLACVHVNLSNKEVSDEALQRIGRLPRIGNLLLDGSSITDGGLEHIGNLTQLQHLSLEDTRITDVGLQHLQGMSQLVMLSLHGTRVTDAGLERLSRFWRLEYLDLSGTDVTEVGVKRLQELLPNCEIIDK